MTPQSTPSSPQWNIHAAIAGWMVPGLGHLLLGQRRRAGVLFLTISSIWLSGALIGGICIFDYQDHPLAFIGQALIGPSFAGNIVFNKIHNQDPDPTPGNDPPYEPSFGRVNEQAILYTAMAGLLNMLAVLDALYCDPVRRRSEFGQVHLPGTEPAPDANTIRPSDAAPPQQGAV